MHKPANAGIKNIDSDSPMIIKHPKLSEQTTKLAMPGNKSTVYRPVVAEGESSYHVQKTAATAGDCGWLWGVRVVVSLCCAVLLAALWATVDNTLTIRALQKQVSNEGGFLPYGNSGNAVQDLKERVALLETILAQVVQDVFDLREDDLWEDDYYELRPEEEDDNAEEGSERVPRVRRETVRRPSRYMIRPVPVYNKAYGIDLKKNGEGLQLYSSLQGPLENVIAPSDDSDKGQQQHAAPALLQHRPARNRRQRPPASFLKSGPVRRRRPQRKNLIQDHHRTPEPSQGGLVKNRDVLYRDSLYKNTPGDDAWDAAVSKVQQGAPTTPVPITVTQRLRKKPRKRNSRRRNRGARATAAHFNGLPAATGRSSVWEAAEWVDALGLNSRYRTGGDHIKVAEPGIYLLYAQVKYGYGSSSGYDVKINGRTETSCSQGLVDQGVSTCHTTVVAYLPKNSVVRLEGHAPGSAVLELKDGEHASVGLIKMLEAPDNYRTLYSSN